MYLHAPIAPRGRSTIDFVRTFVDYGHFLLWFVGGLCVLLQQLHHCAVVCSEEDEAATPRASRVMTA
jgi:hypothetical protein